MNKYLRIIPIVGLYCLTVGPGCDPDPEADNNDNTDEQDGSYRARSDSSDSAIVDIEVGPAARRPAPPPKDLEISNCDEGIESPEGGLVWDFLPKTPALVEGVDPTALTLAVETGLEQPVLAEFHLVADDGRGTEYTYEIRDQKADGDSKAVEVYDLTDAEFDPRRMQTSRLLSAWVVLTDPKTGDVVAEYSAEPVFFHHGTKDQLVRSAELPTEITAYDRHTLEQTYRGGDLLGVVPRDIDEGYEHGETIPSRVIEGGAPIVTPGRTTPEELAKRGLLPMDVADQLSIPEERTFDVSK